MHDIASLALLVVTHCSCTFLHGMQPGHMTYDATSNLLCVVYIVKNKAGIELSYPVLTLDEHEICTYVCTQ